MKNILIVSLNAVGDAYISKSALPVFQSNFTCLQVWFLIGKRARFLFNEKELKIISIEKNIPEILNAWLILRKIKFDYILIFFPGIVNTFFFFSLKSNEKGGFLFYFRKSNWHNRNLKGIIKAKGGVKKIFWNKNENYIRLVTKVLEGLNIGGTELACKIKPYEFEHSRYAEFIVVHPYSRINTRRLTLEQILTLNNYFVSEFKKPVVFIGDNKVDCLKSKGLKVKSNIPLNELVELVNPGLFVSVDSFPLHLADAYNSNFIGLFGDTLPASVLFNSQKAIRFNVAALSEVAPEILIKKLIIFLEENEIFRNRNK